MKVLLIRGRHSCSDRLVGMLKKVPDLEIVMQWDNAGDVTELCAEHTPDLLMMEALSKEWSVLEYIPQIKQSFPDIKVFVLTEAKDNISVLKAREAGADIVARKNLSLDELTQLIHYSQKHYRVFPNTRLDPQGPL